MRKSVKLQEKILVIISLCNLRLILRVVKNMFTISTNICLLHQVNKKQRSGYLRLDIQHSHKMSDCDAIAVDPIAS